MSKAITSDEEIKILTKEEINNLEEWQVSSLNENQKIMLIQRKIETDVELELEEKLSVKKFDTLSKEDIKNIYIPGLEEKLEEKDIKKILERKLELNIELEIREKTIMGIELSGKEKIADGVGAIVAIALLGGILYGVYKVLVWAFTYN